MTKMGRNRNSKHKISMVRGVGGRDKRESSAFMKTGRWWLGFVLWPLRWCVYSYIYKSVASTCSLSPLQFWLRVFNTKLTSSYCANCHHCPWYCHRRACRVVVWVCVIFFICSLSSSLSLSLFNFTVFRICVPFIIPSHWITTALCNVNDLRDDDGSRCCSHTHCFRSIMFCIGKQAKYTTNFTSLEPFSQVSIICSTFSGITT